MDIRDLKIRCPFCGKIMKFKETLVELYCKYYIFECDDSFCGIYDFDGHFSSSFNLKDKVSLDISSGSLNCFSFDTVQDL